MNGLIIFLCRNNISLSKECLRSIRKQTPAVDILAVNNASTDGTTQWLRNERIRIMSFQYQQSVAKCWNEALRWAWSAGYSEALVLNNDTEILPETYQVLSDWALAEETGMTTCVSRRERSELTYATPFSHRPNPDFSCFLIQKWAFTRVGGFDERYAIAFGEDCDFHVRLHRAGIRAECIDLPFLHHGSQTVKRSNAKEAKLIGIQAEANRRLFYNTYGRQIGTPGYNDLFTSLVAQ